MKRAQLNLALFLSIVFLSIEAYPKVSKVLFEKVERNKTKERANAVVYEKPNRQGKSASYIDHPYMWSNVKDVIREAGLKEIKSVCVTGTFLLYQKKGYEAHHLNHIRMISGKGSCLEPGHVIKLPIFITWPIHFN